MMVDGHALVHRAFHALPEDLATSAGEPTNAVLGFTNIVLKVMAEKRPSHILMAMDRPVPTFRHERFADYKATRPPMPRILAGQFARVREVADALGIRIFELDGYEADDVLGTLAGEAEREGIDTLIVTGDLDALQLVSDRVHVLTPGRGVAETTEYDVDAVRNRYGIEPGQLPDWKALVGDTSDNIPGVRGIGNKGATKLVAEFGSLEGIFAHLDELPARMKQLLEDAADQAYESRELATILRNAPIELPVEDTRNTGGDRAKLVELFRDLEFYSLIERIQSALPRAASEPAWKKHDTGPEQLAMFEIETLETPGTANGGGFGSVPAPVLPPAADLGSHVRTTVVRSEEELRALVRDLSNADIFAFDTETTSTDPMRARLVGLSFSTERRAGWYVPVNHAEGQQLEIEVVLKALRPLLADPGKGESRAQPEVRLCRDGELRDSPGRAGVRHHGGRVPGGADRPKSFAGRSGPEIRARRNGADQRVDRERQVADHDGPRRY